MTEVHLVLGLTLIGLNLIAGIWGGTVWIAQRASAGFWYALRAAQASVVAQAVLGMVLMAGGREPADGLHIVYGLAPLLVTLLAEGARAGAAEHELEDVDFEALEPERQRLVALAIVRRETGIMAVSALVIVALALRAALTSAAF